MILKHILLYSGKEQEHFIVLSECKRIAAIGGSFKIENKYHDGQWTSFITIYYPNTYTVDQ